MKLLTKALEKKFMSIGRQEDDPTIVCKFFHPFSDWTWYATEYDPEERMFFGRVDGFESEMGYFSLDELESVKVRGLGIERDLYFKERKMSEL